MNISKDTVVTLNYTVNAGPGQPPESGQQAYLHGGYGNTFAKLEAALEGQAPGFATTLVLQPEDAFGVRDESLVRTIPKSEFPPGVKVGGQLRGMTDDGREQVFNVVKIKGPQVLLDGNHPFAGKVLRFTLKVLEVRAATPEEVTHGHAHGVHGHHH